MTCDTPALACSPSTASPSVTCKPSRGTPPPRSPSSATPTTTIPRQDAPPTRWATYSLMSSRYPSPLLIRQPRVSDRLVQMTKVLVRMHSFYPDTSRLVGQIKPFDLLTFHDY